eukprot:1100131-Rhodomonas_salina.1
MQEDTSLLLLITPPRHHPSHPPPPRLHDNHHKPERDLVEREMREAAREIRRRVSPSNTGDSTSSAR